MTKRFLAAALALTVLATLTAALGPAGPAAARPKVPNRPNGLTLQQADRSASAAFGDCAGSGVHCKPGGGGSCTGYTSQVTPPKTIRVYIPSVPGYAYRIQTIPFETYVENVLPNEWSAGWDGDALKAGAVAVTSYAWYWTTHYGGYVNNTESKSTCFDVTDDTNFQVYKAKSAQANSTSKVQQVYPTAIRVSGTVLQASYVAAVRTDYNFDDKSTYDACGQGVDGTFLSQSGSQTCNEDNTANKWPVILQTYYGSDIQLATTAQLRSQHDFQYLHHSTPATFSNGTWTIADGYPTTLSLGQAGDTPVVNTVGDGFARVGVYRPSTSTWYLGTTTGATRTSFAFGLANDVPVAAQYNGLSAATQVAVWRPSNGTWYFAGPTGGTASTIQYGLNGDTPVPGRWLSATKDSVAVFRVSSSVWYIRGGATVQYGLKGDIPTPADYTGDGKTDIAFWRPSNSSFYVRGQAAVQWGLKGDVPVTGDFNGDGKADLVVYRPSNHTLYVRGIETLTLPAAGTPIGKAPYAD